MNKQVKLLIILGAILLILVLYIVISSRVVTISSTENTSAPEFVSKETEKLTKKVDPIKLEENYQSSTKLALEELTKILLDAKIAIASSGNFVVYPESVEAAPETENNNFAENLAQLKINLMDLLVPEDYKEMHFNLVLSIAKFKEFIDEPINVVTRDEGLALLNQALSGVDWIN